MSRTDWILLGVAIIGVYLFERFRTAIVAAVEKGVLELKTHFAKPAAAASTKQVTTHQEPDGAVSVTTVITTPHSPDGAAPPTTSDPLWPEWAEYLAAESSSKSEWDKPDHAALRLLLDVPDAKVVGTFAGVSPIDGKARGALEKAARCWKNDAYVRIINGDAAAWKAAVAGDDHLLACFAYACSRGVEPVAYPNGDPQ